MVKLERLLRAEREPGRMGKPVGAFMLLQETWVTGVEEVTATVQPAKV